MRAPGFVDVWLAALPDVIGERDWQLLDACEREKVRSYREPRHGSWYGGGRSLARGAIASYLERSAGEVELHGGPCPRCGSRAHGPPLIADPPSNLRISLSRSLNLMAVAVGTTTVGIDLEHLDLAGDVASLATMTLSADEADLVLDLTDCARQREAFLRCWTRKEAVLKAVGVGLVADLREIEVRLDLRGGRWLTDHRTCRRRGGRCMTWPSVAVS